MNDAIDVGIGKMADPDRPSPLKNAMADPDRPQPLIEFLDPDSPSPLIEAFAQEVSLVIPATAGAGAANNLLFGAETQGTEQEVPVRGKYGAFAKDDKGILVAGDIKMSGTNPRAELHALPTLVEPNEFKLVGYTSFRQFMNLVVVATATAFDCTPDSQIVKVQDRDGVHDVPIRRVLQIDADIHH